ncbi:MAG: DUF1566 domain-containing protein [Candidatus Thiodiazotropha lotti]|nr:DUF1566 domain-containing protein [Candidatus Thiodiazotropha lotti]
MGRFIIRALIFVCLIFTLPSLARAQISSDFGGANGGAVVIGESTTTCDSSIEGAIRYDSATPCVELCDGSSWACAGSGGSGGCTAPSSCPDVGDVCTDGSLFAGFMLYSSSCEALYVTDNNQSASSQWKTSTGTDDISPDDFDDGNANHTNRSGTLTDFPAFDLCESNTYHSKSDWYLPARTELYLLWLNRAAINANAQANFVTTTYRSSTENNTFTAWYQSFADGTQQAASKASFYDVRCVRRD